MKPLKPAVCDQSSVIKVVNDLHAKWVQGDKLMREQFPASDATAALAAMLAHMEAMNANEQIFINGLGRFNRKFSQPPTQRKGKKCIDYYCSTSSQKYLSTGSCLPPTS